MSIIVGKYTRLPIVVVFGVMGLCVTFSPQNLNSKNRTYFEKLHAYETKYYYLRSSRMLSGWRVGTVELPDNSPSIKQST